MKDGYNKLSLLKVLWVWLQKLWKIEKYMVSEVFPFEIFLSWGYKWWFNDWIKIEYPEVN
jgi:hypothetical protein